MPRPSIVAVALCSWIATSVAHAQCPGRWLPNENVSTSAGGGAVSAIAALPGSGDFIVAGTFDSAGGVAASNIALYHAHADTWSSIDGVVISGGVHCLAVLSDGDIVIGGRFTTSPGNVANNIVRWSPSTGGWSLLGSGAANGVTGMFGAIGGSVVAMVPLPDGDFVAIGEFTGAGGSAAGGAARWHALTNSWSAVGSGFTSCFPVNPDCPALLEPVQSAATVLPDASVVFGGNFLYASGVAASYIARWDPASDTWSGLDGFARPFIDHPVNALAVLPSGDLVAGGMFTSAGGMPAGHIAIWNPNASAWSAMDSGTPSNVVSIAALPSGDVLAGSSGVPSQIMLWSASTGTWSVVGAPFGGGTPTTTISAIAAMPNGDILAGGNFLTAGSTPAAHFARWTTLPMCPADFDCSGTLDVQDIFAFLDEWFEGSPTADFNHAGGLSVQDIFDFLAAWFGGC